MKYIILLLFLIFCSFAFSQQADYTVDALVTPKKVAKTLRVGGTDADIRGFDRQAIQMAIEAVAETGGVVRLDPGTYHLLAPVSLRSNVQLIGSGRETILKRMEGIQTQFIVDADYGELKLTVKNPDGFLPGMKIQVTDEDQNSCWNVSTAYIIDIQDNVIYIDDHLIRDYRADRGGLVSNASSVIEVIGAENVGVADLTADGNMLVNFLSDGCNGAGVYIFKSKNVIVDNVHVKDFNGEGISWQITENVTVRNSEISGSGNIGLHPGTGSPLSTIENNDVHHNKVDGLFICWRVHHSVVKGNKFHHNGRYGICTGHKDSDVLFEGNHVYNNGSDGIHLRGEREPNAPHRNTFTGNIIENNGMGGSGYGFSVNSPAKDLILKDNTIRDTENGTQKAAVFIYENGSEPRMENNRIEKHAHGPVVYEKK
ncbi:MAG: right-handed parallel beta-helix repeat-containing protein [Cyclobacteriaceae bacterium]|nr:right-handed parallel beta-helix repeat-containing protein [Cyclobacteriaceae bacterium]